MGARVYAKKEEAYDTKQNNMYNGFEEVIHLSGFYFVLILFLNTLDSVDNFLNYNSYVVLL